MRIFIIIAISYILFITFFTLSMIYASNIKNDTSSGNPFNLEEESDKLNYFKYEVYSYFPDKAYCKCEEKIFIDFCNEDLLQSGCQNYYESTKFKNFVQFSECKEIQNKIMNYNLKLIDIFKLETNSINSSIISLITFDIIIFILIILAYPVYKICLSSIVENKDVDCSCCDSPCCSHFLGWIIVTFIGLIIIVFLIITIVDFSITCGIYNGDDTRKFLEFLECSNVKKEGFYKYSSLEDLSSHFTLLKAFQSLFIIFICLSCFVIIFERYLRIYGI